MSNNDETAIKRLEGILARMGWDENELAKGIYKQLGYKSPKGVQHWFLWERRRLPSTDALRAVCDYLGVDPCYLIGMHDDLEGSADPHGRFTLATRARPSTA